MSNPFFDQPILNSPYACPQRHWELDEEGQPTQKVEPFRRKAKFITPVPKPKKRKKTDATQEGFVFDEGKGLSTKAQQYDPTSIINEVRGYVDTWRKLPNPNQWQVTPETSRLLQHWRHHKFSGVRPFFCQVEAVETAIWLTEVAPQSASGKRIIEHLDRANKDANRVMPDLMGMKNILVINDEAHHCYREKPEDDSEFTDEKGNKLTGEELKDAKARAKKDSEAARVWISGLESVNRKLGVARVLDLSATPFFLSGSGYVEGTLFPWTMSDFSLMDAIECGIVKLPRVPVAQNLPGASDDEMPMFRELWKHIRTKMPKKGRGAGEELDPLKLPTLLKTALEALYGHYEKTHKLWKTGGTRVPPCFIVVCNNTATSKLVYDYISGFHQKNEDGTSSLVNGRLALFRNFDETTGNPLPRPNTLLIDSEQLESGEALDDNFRAMATDEIERFRREIIERKKDAHAADNLTDQDLLREVMNTVGKEGQLGAGIRCVVSVSMLTEGWDANNVTHVLGVRAFGTQLLCEQVIGRALRRLSYDLNDENLFNVEYADVLGIPFDFTAKPVIAPPKPPRPTVQVRAVRPERDHLEIRFPRVEGYRVELPEERIEARFDDDSILGLTPELVGPSITQNAGIIGETVNLNLEHLGDMRPSSLLFNVTHRLLYTKFRDPGEPPPLHLFGQLKRVTKQWLDTCLQCKGGTYPALLMYQELADIACDRITAGITRAFIGERPIKALLDPYNPSGSTNHVRFNTSKTDRWDAKGPPPKCHINWVVLDSDWEAEFCRVAEAHPKVRAYVKNHNLGLEVPYRYASELRKYLPDFIVLVDDGHGDDDPLHLIVEIKGYRGEDAKEKASTMKTYWVPGVNHLGTHGRWAFAEFCDVYEIESDFAAKVAGQFEKMLQTVAAK